MKLYVLVCDGGDGSASVEWFKHRDRASQLIDENDYYRCNDHVSSITLPDGFDVNTLGISINEEEAGEDLDDEE